MARHGHTEAAGAFYSRRHTGLGRPPPRRHGRRASHIRGRLRSGLLVPTSSAEISGRFRAVRLLLALASLAYVLSSPVHAQTQPCGSPPQFDRVTQEVEILKGDAAAKADFLAKLWSRIGVAASGELMKERRTFYQKASEVEAARLDAFFQYMFCTIIMNDGAMTTDQKIKAIQGMRADVRKQSSCAAGFRVTRSEVGTFQYNYSHDNSCGFVIEDSKIDEFNGNISERTARTPESSHPVGPVMPWNSLSSYPVGPVMPWNSFVPIQSRLFGRTPLIERGSAGGIDAQPFASLRQIVQSGRSCSRLL
jgi:hypothetical protein